jgi:hypothetical protein
MTTLTRKAESFLYENIEGVETLPAMAEIDTFLRQAGYTPIRTGRTKGGYGCTVNRADYGSEDGQNIFIIVNNAGSC